MNTNCLEGLRCPQCGNNAKLVIAGNSFFEVTDDGTESHGDVEWDNNSATRCPECHFAGLLKQFDGRDDIVDDAKTYEVVAYAKKRYTCQFLAVSAEDAVAQAHDVTNADNLDGFWVDDNEYYDITIVDNPEEVKDV